MTLRFPRAVDRYLKHGHVQGFLNPFSAEFIARLSEFQSRHGITGSVAEIGIHHGKLFFVLYLTTLTNESALAIDVFENQHLNTDKSGRGNKAMFLRHARNWAPGLNGLVVMARSSLEITPDDILSTVGLVRLFSIDGSHTHEATLNDLALAEAVLAAGGIVVVDDCFNEFWPEVSGALSDYLKSTTLHPFAITPGKIFLCHEAMLGTYNAWLASVYPNRIDKSAKLFGHPVKVVGMRSQSALHRFARSPLGLRIRGLLHR